MKIDTLDRIEGILLGTAVGDALGLPMECMTPSTIQTLGWANEWKHRFVMHRGMWSDDTEHSIMIAQSLLASQGCVEKFRCAFAWELRWWLLGLPSGVGMATARAIIKLWLGYSAKTSGVYSAGNGPCMRTAIIAAYFPNDLSKRRSYTEVQATISHSDPKATIAATGLTELTALLLNSNSTPSAAEVLATLARDDTHHCEEWNSICYAIESAVSNRIEFSEFLTTIGIDPHKGISGYAYHTVPAVIYSGLVHNWDFESVVTEIIAAGGDTDTTAAIAGALCGAHGGASSIPHHWIAGIAECPTGISELKCLAKAIQSQSPLMVRSRWSPALLLRNVFFLAVVLKHSFTRLLPNAIRARFS